MTLVVEQPLGGVSHLLGRNADVEAAVAVAVLTLRERVGADFLRLRLARPILRLLLLRRVHHVVGRGVQASSSKNHTEGF